MPGDRSQSLDLRARPLNGHIVARDFPAIDPCADSVVVAQVQLQPVGKRPFGNREWDAQAGLRGHAPHRGREVGSDPRAVTADGGRRQARGQSLNVCA